jgi:putative membrane protein
VLRFVIGWLALAFAVGVATAVVPGMDVDGGLLTYLWIAALFAVVNVILGPILRLLSLPLMVITLGLFSLVVNGFLVVVTAWLSSKLSVSGFGTAILAALVISLVNMVVGFVLRPVHAMAD